MPYGKPNGFSKRKNEEAPVALYYMPLVDRPGRLRGDRGGE